MKYSVYHLNNELVIGNTKTLTGHKGIIFYEPFDWDYIISKFENEKEVVCLILLSEEPEKAWNSFVQKYQLIEAAGGLIFNKKRELLVIYRLGKWDLPKGKIDMGEIPLQTAIREIKEECNVNVFAENSDFLDCTFHTYTLHKKRILKKTHWFIFHIENATDTIPQTEENIENVEWVSNKKWHELTSNSYPSIIQIINKCIEPKLRS
jgi:8-oxo-dGTP pyrophosphatase MutT (NUDIX family)